VIQVVKKCGPSCPQKVVLVVFKNWSELPLQRVSGQVAHFSGQLAHCSGQLAQCSGQLAHSRPLEKLIFCVLLT